MRPTAGGPVRQSSRFPVLVPLLLAVACGGNPPASAQDSAPASPQPESMPGVVSATTVASGLEHPWALAFLPDGRLLVTERPGRLRIVTMEGTVSAPLTGVPDVYAQSQGGLLDVALDPDFASNRLVYLSFAEPGEGGSGTAVARGRLGERGLEGTTVIFRQRPKVRSQGHFGSRLVFTRDGRLFVTLGDRQASQFRGRAQLLDQGMGKIMRIDPDGSVPRDNPFVDRAGAQPEVWSYGHRNVQAAALHPETGELWTVEHGARGGDELNNPQAGRNYGWPVITYGRDYSGASIGEGTAKEGMEQPVYYWDPVIAPSGMAFYTSDSIPGWKGSILVGSMNPGALVRLVLEDGKVVREERYLGELGARIRDVQVGPDGFVYAVTDAADGKVLRIKPAN
jgi:glucose/arabinose dehydrogenase